MKLQEDLRTTYRSGDFEERNFAMRPEDAPHIFSILRDKLYSDKITAVIREYSTNAVDAHVESGKPDLPIDVLLPTSIEPNLKIRDYGEGLSPEGIFETYVCYGRSTKRNTNEAIGQLGLGSKSAFCYCDTFTIVSYYKGIKYIYSAYIDETKVGSVALLHKEPSNEPSGIEIIVPVHRWHIVEFRNKAENIFRYFTVTPNVRGNNTFKIEKNEYVFWNEEEKWGIEKRSRLNYYYRTAPVAIMGGIGYNIDVNTFEDISSSGKSLLSCPICIHFDIGELSISASREALEYNEYTKKNIIKKLEIITNSLIQTIEKQIECASTKFEALCLLMDLFSSDFNFGSILREISQNCGFKWKDKVIFPSSIESIKLPSDIVLFEPNGEKLYKKSWNYTRYSKSLAIAVVDNCRFWKVRASALFDSLEDINTILVVRKFESLEKVKEELSLEDSEIYKLSEVDISKKKIVSQNNKDKKHSLKCFKMNWDNYPNALGRTKSACWDAVEIDLEKDSHVYVDLDYFEISSQGVKFSPTKLVRIRKNLEKLGINLDDLYGIKVSIREKIGKNFVPLKDFVLNKIMEKFNEENAHQLISDYSASKNFIAPSHSLLLECEDKIENKDNIVLSYIKAINKMQEGQVKAQKFLDIKSFYKEVGILKEEDFKPSQNLMEMREEIYNKYPLLRFMGFFENENFILSRFRDFYGGHYWENDLRHKSELRGIEKIIDYINLTDKMEKKND